MNAESVAIRAVRYDPVRAKLLVRFSDGERHVYVGVPSEVGRSFRQSRSKTDFFEAEIADRYPFNRLRD